MIMKKIFYAAASLAVLFGCSCCTVRDNTIPGWPWHDPDDPDDPWTEITGEYTNIPEYVKLYKSPAMLLHRSAVAYYASVDMTRTDMKVWGLNDPTLSGVEAAGQPLRTPRACYEKVGNPCVIINGGFFYTDSGKNYAASLAISEGQLLSPNINYASEDWVTMYYPTRGVFLQTETGFVTGWTYWQSTENHYFYTSPAANSWGADPLQVPDATFPTTATSVVAKNGIGAGPVLIKDGKIVCTYREELFNGETSGILCDTRHPRTAIGITADKHLIMFVCEGRQMTAGVEGYTLDEVAKIMKNLGCVEALNLDGGGSTCMLINGVETVKPSDGEERPVGSCIYISR